MIYTLTIILHDRKPLNQRIIQISDQCSFEQLANIIIDIYWFHGEHLWEFRDEDKLTINHPEYSIPEDEILSFTDPEFDDLQWVALQKSAANYKLSDYFIDHTLIEFIYDFGANRKFDILFTRVDEEDIYNVWWTMIVDNKKTGNYCIVSGTGCYLIDDSGGTTELKEFIDQYIKQKRDADWRETREDFAERIQPAMRSFNPQNHR